MPDNYSPPRRGAPPGNTNALKHGRYARKYHPVPVPGLAEHQFRDLQEEALILRVFIARVVELYPDLTDAKQSLSVLRALSSAMLSLARIMRTNAYLDPVSETTRLLNAFEQAALDLSTAAQPSPSSLSDPACRIPNNEFPFINSG
jgi:hypothetical protein